MKLCYGLSTTGGTSKTEIKQKSWELFGAPVFVFLVRDHCL